MTPPRQPLRLSSGPAVLPVFPDGLSLATDAAKVFDFDQEMNYQQGLL
jgi:hypothetical protein